MSIVSNLLPGSYIFSHIDPVLQATRLLLGFGGQASYPLRPRSEASKLPARLASQGEAGGQVSRERLHAHPDFYLIKSEGSIGIDIIREAGHYLRMKPIMSSHKFLIIENFHLATEEAQNAFLKTFEEPPEYAYIFLVTPYIDRLLKTIVSRAQVIQGLGYRVQGIGKFELQTILQMSIGERFLWLENEIKHIDDKIQVKLKLLEMIDSFLTEGLALVKKGTISLEALECLKEARWKTEQGFPNPRLLVEEFLLILEGENS